KQQNQKEQAIAAYTEAVNSLKSLRKDLVAIDQNVQFSFRESVEPVYRELVDLILQSPTQENLKTARELIESLQLAELDNFFQEACLDQKIKPQQIDQIDSQAAVIYPIILANRLEVIISIPDQPLKYYSTPIPQEQVETTLRRLRLSFQPIFSTKERVELSQQVYEWLLRAAEPDLKNNSIKTLVFVLDGSLRNIPMAALYDGKKYLVETYNLALTPGLQLLASRSLKPNQLQTLTVGLSEARQGFSALPAVASEIQQIQENIPTKVLLNQQFTRDAVQQQIQKTAFPIVHLATHGQFSSKAEDTFLLTWESRINVKDLDYLLRSRQPGEQNPVELLVLSACETATGDQRAALGLAGVAVRSGARSTLATLWQVNDTSTASLMAQFYQELVQPQVTKAQALRQAQLKLLQQPKYQDPYYWAPFVLVGNWQ
ncbi:MAG: CHAT domain-containing protein, partial [Planktothrix sp.]